MFKITKKGHLPTPVLLPKFAQTPVTWTLGPKALSTIRFQLGVASPVLAEKALFSEDTAGCHEKRDFTMKNVGKCDLNHERCGSLVDLPSGY